MAQFPVQNPWEGREGSLSLEEGVCHPGQPRADVHGFGSQCIFLPGMGSGIAASPAASLSSLLVFTDITAGFNNLFIYIYNLINPLVFGFGEIVEVHHRDMHVMVLVLYISFLVFMEE